MKFLKLFKKICVIAKVKGICDINMVLTAFFKVCMPLDNQLR